MSTAAEAKAIQVRVDERCFQAEMVIPRGFPQELLTRQVCLEALRQSGVEVTEAVVAAVELLLRAPPGDHGERRGVVARAMPAVHGKDGYIEWLVGNEWDPEGDGSYYERRAYVVVKPGQVVGRVVGPTAGRDGRDVTGRVLRARPGRPVGVKLDESVISDAAGQLVSQAEGVLERTAERVRVRQVLEVPDYVDFSTGNINFTGDVSVHGGVRDCFVVKATGHVDVQRLIEAATVECGGDLIARGGMAGRDRGHVQVGGRFVGKYLNNVTGTIDGDVSVDTEIISCELTIHGGVHGPNSRIVGGKLVVVGRVVVSALGSGAGVATELVLGTVPKLESPAAGLAKVLEQLTAKQQALIAERDQIKKNTRWLTSLDQEKLAEIESELRHLGGKLATGLTAYEAVSQRIAKLRTVDVTVRGRLHAGVLLTIGLQVFRIREEVLGPLKVRLNEAGVPVCEKSSGEVVVLSQLAEVRAVRSKDGPVR